MNDPDVRRIVDEEHLRLLRIGYLVSGATGALFSLFPLFYVAFGAAILGGMSSSLSTSFPGRADLDPRLFGWIFVAAGLSFFLFLAGSAVLKLAAARAIGRRRMHTFCLVTAALTTLGFPWGTVLGILSFIVLERPDVKAMFAAAPPGVSRPWI